MIKYRGYYIEPVSANGFHSKEEIDEFIKKQAIERYKTYCRLFSRRPSVELSVIMANHADYMHRSCSISHADIEDIEIEVFSAA